MPEQDQFADIPWPQHGIDISSGFGLQVPLTTPTGINVRTFEALTQRARGGSRPGLAQFIPQALPLSYVSGSRLIQELNLVVDPSADALTGNTDPPAGTDTIDDPTSAGPVSSWPPGGSSRNPGRKIRRGGSGRQQNKNKKKAASGYSILIEFDANSDPLAIVHQKTYLNGHLLDDANVGTGIQAVAFDTDSGIDDKIPADSPITSGIGLFSMGWLVLNGDNVLMIQNIAVPGHLGGSSGIIYIRNYAKDAISGLWSLGTGFTQVGYSCTVDSSDTHHFTLPL